MRTAFFWNKTILNIEQKMPSITHKSLFVLLLTLKYDTNFSVTGTQQITRLDFLSGYVSLVTDNKAQRMRRRFATTTRIRKERNPIERLPWWWGPTAAVQGFRQMNGLGQRGEVAGSSCSNHFHRSPLFLHEDLVKGPHTIGVQILVTFKLWAWGH